MCIYIYIMQHLKSLLYFHNEYLNFIEYHQCIKHLSLIYFLGGWGEGLYQLMSVGKFKAYILKVYLNWGA